MSSLNSARPPVGSTVTKIGFESWYVGEVWGYQKKWRQEWAVVKWRGHQFTSREYPHALREISAG